MVSWTIEMTTEAGPIPKLGRLADDDGSDGLSTVSYRPTPPRAVRTLAGRTDSTSVEFTQGIQ